MKIVKLRLQTATNHSFIVHNEVYPFAPYHHHPEFEMVLVLQGNGRRMVGDNVDRFGRHDLVFTGPFLPHQWLCDSYPEGHPEYRQEKSFVIQFLYDFLGEKFFEIPENANLKKFLAESVRGCRFYGKTREKIIDILLGMKNGNDSDRFYRMFSIFEIFAGTREFHFLSSAKSVDSYIFKENDAVHKTMQYIMQNLQDKILVKDLLDITNMSYPAFYALFKRHHKLSFKEYLLELRIEYACKLLKDRDAKISNIAFSCGFENLSNFNRQFKRIRNMTPSDYQKELLISGQLHA
jgi:AraC-like DNA-binding protein